MQDLLLGYGKQRYFQAVLQFTFCSATCSQAAPLHMLFHRTWGSHQPQTLCSAPRGSSHLWGAPEKLKLWAVGSRFICWHPLILLASLISLIHSFSLQSRWASFPYPCGLEEELVVLRDASGPRGCSFKHASTQMWTFGVFSLTEYLHSEDILPARS